MARSRHHLPNLRIGVVGTGAIGCYYGGRLAYFGRDVHFLVRSGWEDIRRFGIRVRNGKDSFRVAKVNAGRTPAEIGACDLVLIALKTTANPVLTELLPPLLHEKTMLVTLQNGLGNEEFLAKNFGRERILGGLCFICLQRTGPGAIEHFDAGHLSLGEFDRFPQPRTHDIAWEFKRCGVVCRVVENLARERWRKLVWNIPFNGLSVTEGGKTTADLLAEDALRLRVLALMEEVIAAANKRGHFLPVATALEQIKRTESMGPYKPSTLLDFEAARPLEIESIWGEPLRQGLAAGAAMPELQKLYARLRELSPPR